MYFYEPRLGHGLPHDPFNAIVGPRPIGWISSHDSEGRLNLAPYSFFNAFNYTPPLIGFASVGAKDTLRNIEATGEFVWNLATRDLAEAMNLSSAPLPPGVSEFERAGLATAPSTVIQVPRVAASPVAFECRRTQILRLQGADGKAVDTWLILGEVVGVHINEALLVNGIYNTAAARPVLRGGGAGDYFELGDLFRMSRPTA
jgi:flavin reductase (DIM6/NTAB) family NADH-FMN oxidoreductase RutF